MLETLSQNILYEYSFAVIYLLVFLYFLLLYFGIAPLFKKLCTYLEKKKVLEKINHTVVKKKQKQFEVKHSFVSIIVFGFSAFPIIYLARMDYLHFLDNSFLNIIIGLVILNLWNELHFFIIHKIMHQPFFMKHVHAIHHRSVIPTVYSVYSFHWLEAALLSTVPLTAVLIIPLAPIAIFIYPICSILLNFAGHCNYKLIKPPFSFLTFATRHSAHHKKGRGEIGFALDIFDRIFSTKNK